VQQVLLLWSCRVGADVEVMMLRWCSGAEVVQRCMTPGAVLVKV